MLQIFFANAIIAGMIKTPPRTPLHSILRHLSPAQRAEFAAISGTSVNYLYQLALCHRSSCSSTKALGIADASSKMAAKYGSLSLAVADLARMCPLKGVA